MPPAIRGCKNDLGSGSPVFEAVGYYAQLLNNVLVYESRFPCVLIIDLGSFLGFYGCLWTGKNIHVEPLTPMHDLTVHWTDEISRNAIASSLDAFKRTIERIEEYYESLLRSPAPAVVHAFPYPTSYKDETGQDIDFTYQSRVEEKLVFVALTVLSPEENLCIKFTRRYSEEAHRLLADLECSPRLRQALAIHLIDFDWAGTYQKVRYPERVNTKTVRRPDGVSRGELITKDHDMAMVDLLFRVPN
ncbi:hypothetical protein ACEPAI_1397 [Sanghuangporus weigelae]